MEGKVFAGLMWSRTGRLEKDNLPRIAITMGYAGGIGPETVVKTLSTPKNRSLCRPIVIGDSKIIHAIAKTCGLAISWNIIESPEQAEFKPEEIDLVDLHNISGGEFEYAKVIPSVGKASGEYLEIAWKAAMNGIVDGVVSGTLNKEALHKGGYAFRDELELFSKITGSQWPFSLGVTGDLWCIPVTDHISFKAIAQGITRQSVLFHITAINQKMRRYGFDRPRIAVAALNVHGGEGGLFGNEEKTAITPAIEEARNLGIEVSGPFPADTIFIRAQNGEFDSIVGMYHDQINIGRKLIGIMKGTTLFMGLPVPCGTTAHGTAFDKAGKGVASPTSMEDTLRIVSRLSQRG